MQNSNLQPCPIPAKKPPRPRVHVKFDSVYIFHFERTQGHMCVPNEGGCSLGMKKNHWKSERVNVNHFYLDKLSKKLDLIIRKSLANYRHFNQTELKEIISNRGLLKNRLKLAMKVPTMQFLVNKRFYDIFDLDRILSGFIDDNLFLQPISLCKRKRMLRRSGQNFIRVSEKRSCQEIRISRQTCGCSCGEICLPSSCECYLNGISCQADRLAFPCSCLTPSNCNNTNGRVTFNAARAKTHFLHTKMRLELESSHSISEEPVGNYNSTEQGNCADCQNTRYIDFLVDNSNNTSSESLSFSHLNSSSECSNESLNTQFPNTSWEPQKDSYYINNNSMAALTTPYCDYYSSQYQYQSRPHYGHNSYTNNMEPSNRPLLPQHSNPVISTLPAEPVSVETVHRLEPISSIFRSTSSPDTNEFRPLIPHHHELSVIPMQTGFSLEDNAFPWSPTISA